MGRIVHCRAVRAHVLSDQMQLREIGREWLAQQVTHTAAACHS